MNDLVAEAFAEAANFRWDLELKAWLTPEETAIEWRKYKKLREKALMLERLCVGLNRPKRKR